MKVAGAKEFRIVFVLALVCGTLSIVFTSLAGGSIFLAPLVPILVMSSYVFWVIKRVDYQCDPEQAGDSMYFLGYLFTLISLTVSTVQMTVGAQDKLSLTGMLGCFGIALTTTILGLVGRVLIGHLQSQPDASLETISAKMTESSYRLYYDVNESLENIRSIRDCTAGALTDLSVQLVNGLKEVSESACHAIENTMGSLSKALQDSNGQAINSIRKCTQAYTDETRIAFNDILSRFSGAIDDFGKRMTSFDPPLNIVAEKLGTMTESLRDPLDRLGDSVSQASKSLDTHRERSIAGLDSLAKSLSTRFSGVVDDFEKRVTSFDPPVQTLFEKVRVLAGEWERTLADVNRGLRNVFVLIDEGSRSIVNSLPGAAELSAQHDALSSSLKLNSALVQGLVEFQDAIKETSGQFVGFSERVLVCRNSMTECVASLGDIENSFKVILNSVKDYSKDLEEETEAAKRATMKVLETLIEIVRVLKKVSLGQA